MIEIPGGFFPRPSIMLVDADTGRQMLTPSSLALYGACLDELKQMGIATLPPFRRSVAHKSAVYLCRLIAFCGLILVVHGTRPPVLQLSHFGSISGGLILGASTPSAESLAVWRRATKRYLVRFFRLAPPRTSLESVI